MVPAVFKTGLLTVLPPVAAVYQTKVWPAGTVAVAVSVGMLAGGQTVCDWLPPLTGAATAVLPTVTASVAGAVWQLPLLAKTLTFPLLLPAP